MTPDVEPVFSSAGPVWPFQGNAIGFEPDDPDLAIPQGAIQNGIREAPERHFQASHGGLPPNGATEPLAPAPTKARTGWRTWKLSLILSCIFHAAVAAALLYAADETVRMEGADFSGIAYLGDSADQVKAGEVSEAQDESVDVTLITMVEAAPIKTVDTHALATNVDAEAVPVEPVRPIEVAKAELVQPTERMEPLKAETQTMPMTDRTEPVTTETRPAPMVSEIVPEVLATDRADLVDDDNVVQKPAETVVEEPVETTETASTKAAPVESAKAERAEATTTATAAPAAIEVQKAEVAEVKPTPKPTPGPKAAAKKAEDGKKAAKRNEGKPKKSGDGGQNEVSSRRGQADGQEKGDSRQASRGDSKNGKVGNAATSNYPGKVRSRLARVARSIRMKKSGEVVVAFSVNSSGSVSSARIQSSSGEAEIDQAALQALRKASPFPPIPENAGRSSWQFSIPLAFSR